MIDPNKRCQVYRNLHTGTWSVRQSGLIVAHPQQILLKNCRFRVQPAGRAKVLAEKKKNVHAYVSGFLSSGNECNSYASKSDIAVHYNPYKYGCFYGELDGRTVVVKSADFVDMDSADIFGCAVIAIWKENFNE